jgi:hypothetical protein
LPAEGVDSSRKDLETAKYEAKPEKLPSCKREFSCWLVCLRKQLCSLCHCFALAKLETQPYLPWQNLKLNIVCPGKRANRKLLFASPTRIPKSPKLFSLTNKQARESFALANKQSEKLFFRKRSPLAVGALSGYPH